MNLYGGGTQSASNIDHSDSADLFNLDVQRTGNDESRYANSQEKTRSYLHRVSTTEIPGDAEPAEQNDHDNKSVPGCLPGHHVVDKPSMVTWGIRSDDEIVSWRKKVFLVPYGKFGRGFIDQVTLHINDGNSSSDNQHISLKAAFVLLALALQKTKSKTRDHQEVLSKRLTLWKVGEISKFREGRIIQGRIGKLETSNQSEKSKAFAELVLEGQINLASRFLS